MRIITRKQCEKINNTDSKSQHTNDINDFKVGHSQKVVFQTFDDVAVTNVSHVNSWNSGQMFRDSVARVIINITSKVNIDISIDTMIDNMQDCFTIGVNNISSKMFIK